MPAPRSLAQHADGAAPAQTDSDGSALAEAAIRASFDSAPDGVVIVTRGGRLLAFNAAFAALWRFPPEMLARRDVTEMRAHTAGQLGDPESYFASLARLAQTQAPQLFDELPLTDGRVFERHVAPLQLDGDDGVLVVRWRDISARHQAQQALDLSRARLAAVWDNALNAMLLAGDAGCWIDANPAACVLLGTPREALLGRPVAELMVPGPVSTAQAWGGLMQTGKASGRVRLRRPDGSLVLAQMSAVARVQPGVHLCILSDLSDNLRAEQRRQELTALMDLAMMDADLVFWDADLRSGRLGSVNDHWHTMLGYRPDEVADTLEAWDKLVHPDDAARRLLAWEAHLLGSTSLFECEYRIRHKAGHWVWLQSRGRVIERDSDGTPLRVAGLRQDITRRKETEARLEGLAHTDMLTGLLNRRRFTDLAGDELARALRHATPVALLMIDLDHFKAVNDRLGHAGGDAVLRSFALTAEGVVRQGDVFGRVGGEEFAVLLPQTTTEGALALAQRLRERIAAQPAAVGSAAVAYTVSIGVAGWPAPDPAADAAAQRIDIDHLLAAADRALYAAKAQGRDRVVCMDGWA